ncbi:MAG: Methyltransferase type 11 [Candidatus Curtissbacteria bacterium GW2011_GWA1_40_47]|uniref:Methyltransferase domain-containing protein n=1 Tax=Candidatus Curtissbacteria bacterium RIFOXYA1_FULL_41_14 TaxID=1797737 RepID=A0A1F5HB15_9BACT|nr:MAG: Methyltransferase type 11 [Candidatus Curtissbacteria bacterium GW2011_GWB1_40_28]KKR62345.1 MAG: type 11 methyltransferase [Microgenomates group bacterium GW2011_GWC1_40_35]KKR66454.1 MAG: Methyltransferase type 11 [Candidatus Curtissbacteria bacterium GW2011_GWA1_40_47]KKR77886.1 MAG: Methyltransferase type 11 [Candidatus Curtissbacteria bacterium GW2011_GWD1_40_8]KKS02513.1 MAG: Methyltransferase type 11 [Candidatus Curtissbacteria bacterium GW2011_GWC2_41_21]OGD79277.1 MAG: hypothe
MIKKIAILTLKKADILTSVAIRLVKLTGKSSHAVHPKHLLNERVWFQKYLKGSDRVLDLGCGSGQYILKIAPKVKMCFGLDVDKKAISFAQKQAKEKLLKNIKFLIFDANRKLPFANNYFDEVIVSDTLEHLEKRSFVLSQINRVLKKSGLLFLVTDNPQTSWKKIQKSAGLFYYADKDHKYEYSKEEIVKILIQKGFKILSLKPVTYDTPLKPFIDLVGGLSLNLYSKLSKWRKRLVLKNPNETTGFRIVALAK